MFRRNKHNSSPLEFPKNGRPGQSVQCLRQGITSEALFVMAGTGCSIKDAILMLNMSGGDIYLASHLIHVLNGDENEE